jgi:NAD(P)-dependent dehydrogenase (short-subunit alcohol dehydrogenase family)
VTNTTLITGANRGIGLEFARQYAHAGWHVLACCRTPAAAAELNELAKSVKGRVTLHTLDVTDAGQREALHTALSRTPIDLFINNAGVRGQRNNTFGTTDEESWLEVLRVNTIAPLKLMEMFVDRVAASRRKIFANMSSRMGSISDNTSGESYVYRSSKAALNAVAKSAANELRARGITVVMLHPGWVRTDMGGSQALIDVGESVSGLRSVLDKVTLADSGKFFNVKGSVIPW